MDTRWPQRGVGLGGGRMDAAGLQGEFVVHRWIERAKEGDREAMAALYGRYAGTVYAHVKRILGDAHEAEDVTQHVFAKLLTVLPRYERREAPPRCARRSPRYPPTSATSSCSATSWGSRRRRSPACSAARSGRCADCTTGAARPPARR